MGWMKCMEQRARTKRERTPGDDETDQQGVGALSKARHGKQALARHGGAWLPSWAQGVVVGMCEGGGAVTSRPMVSSRLGN